MSNLICRNDNLNFGIAASIILGIIAAALGFAGIITVAPVFYWVTFGIAVGFLAVTLLASPFIMCDKCVLNALPVVSVGAIGTVIISLLLLGTGVLITSVTGAILFGILVALFFITLISVACFMKCIID